MEKEECENCFSDITVKVDKLVNVAKNAIVSMNHAHTVSLEERERQSKEFFKSQEEKHDEYLKNRKENEEIKDKARNRRDNFMLIVFTILCAVIGYNYLETKVLAKEISSKADKEETVKRTEFELLIEQGDEYNRNVFLKKDEIRADTFTYNSNKKLVFKNGLRGEKAEF